MPKPGVPVYFPNIQAPEEKTSRVNNPDPFVGGSSPTTARVKGLAAQTENNPNGDIAGIPVMGITQESARQLAGPQP